MPHPHARSDYYPAFEPAAKALSGAMHLHDFLWTLSNGSPEDRAAMVDEFAFQQSTCAGRARAEVRALLAALTDAAARVDAGATDFPLARYR